MKKSPNKFQIPFSLPAPLFLRFLMLMLPLFWPPPELRATPSDAPVNLESLGFTLLQATPIDFTLERVKGPRQSLKDFQGHWIFLAFWATWCGPCNEEIPQLEALYRKFKKGGLSVVGVSVDQDRSAVEPFQEAKGITFPLFFDSDNRVASQYQASALPTLYVISPDWKLAGVLRGARDWNSPDTLARVAALLGVRHYDGGAGTKMVEEEGTLTLPNNLAPPVLSLDVPTKTVDRGTDLTLTVAVTWKGDPKDYLIKVPKLTLPEGVKLGEISSSSTSENENTKLQYHFPLKLEKEGSLKLGPVELAYSPRTGGKELFSRNEGLTVEVTRRNWAPLIGSLLGAILVFSLGGFWLSRRKKPAGVAGSVNRDWSEPFEQVRQLKMNGRKSEYMAALLKLNLELDQESGAKNPATQSLLEKLEFGGSALSETDLVHFEKRVELAVRKQTLKGEDS